MANITRFDPATFLNTVARGRTMAEHEQGDVIFAQGDQADAVFYIREGEIKVSVVSRHGKEGVIAILGPDEFLGEGCLIGETRRLATATALTKCKTLRVEKSEMQRILHAEPDFSEVFITHILVRKARIEEDLVDHLFNSTEKRLARTLLLLANFGKDGQTEKLMGNISHEMLAEMVGTTRSRVSYFMNYFRKLGFIEYNGHIEVHSSLLNVILSHKARKPAPTR